MHPDPDNRYRRVLEEDPPAFSDKVNSPWDRVPDLEEFNQHAYKRIVRTLAQLERARVAGDGTVTQGILILGEAGTGKTHLLMRVARTLSRTNHVMFVPRPTNEDAVAQHIWANMVSSLGRSLPESGTTHSQLDDLLAHVFTAVLIPEFELDVAENKDADTKRRWVERLKADPYNLFNGLGEGEQRQKNMDAIRRRTLRYLSQRHANIDQQIARALIAYCFASRDNDKRILRTWLAGQELDEGEAQRLGLPASWVAVDESSNDAAVQQRREAQALRAIYTLATLSTYYQPLILAFDQLEGLRDNERLTRRWGDTVREVFTHAPNMLILTCIFPSLWENWFAATFASPEGTSVSQRVAQQTFTLEPFGPQHGRRLLATHLEPSFTKHQLPFDIYPFTESDVEQLCLRATSPRLFLQVARSAFEDWLDGVAASPAPARKPAVPVTQDAIAEVLRSTLLSFETEHRKTAATQVLNEQDFFGRTRNIVETVLKFSDEGFTAGHASCGGRVMPANFVVRGHGKALPVCVAVCNSEGISFTARARNLVTVFQERGQMRRAILLRDGRRKALAAAGAGYVAEFERLGGVYLPVGPEEVALLSAIFDTLVSVEEQDLTVGSHRVDKRQLVHFLRDGKQAERSHFLRAAALQFAPLARTLGLPGDIQPPPAVSRTRSTTAPPPPVEEPSKPRKR